MGRSAGKPKAKRQTRLSFAHPESSSPGLAGSPPETQDRTASVRYVHPFKKSMGLSGYRGRVTQPAEAGGASTTLLPTPENSSQVHRDSEKEDLGEVDKSQVPGFSSPCPVPEKARPTPLNFSSDDEEDIRGQMPSRRSRKAIPEDEESSSNAVTPSKKAKLERPRKSGGGITKRNEVERTSLKLGQVPVKALSVEIMTPSKKSSRRVPQRARRQSQSRSQTPQPKYHISVTSSPEKVEDEDDDEDEGILSRPSTVRSRRLAQRNQPMVELESSESEEDIVTSSPTKRRKRNVEHNEPRTPNKHSEQDQLDLEEDLEDIRESVVTKTRTRGKLADSAKDRRQKHLDILRRRRAGEKPKEAVSSDEGEQDDPSSGDSEEGGGTQGYHYISSDNEENSDIEPEVPPNEDLDCYEEDFVLQDDEEQLGAPTGLEDMPLEFTRHRYKQPREYFKDVVEWMVHNKLNPDFDREDNVYHLAFMRLNDELKGRVGSHYVSSAWNINFIRALEARPEMDTIPFPRSEMHGCDACNRTKNHPASFDIRFRGDPYYLETLEPVSDDEDSNDDSGNGDDSFGKRDRDGNTIPGSEVHFYLGRHCKSKATMAHTLIHWRHNLNGWIIDYLIREDISTKKAMRKRKKWSQDRKAEYVNEVVEMMEEKGEIDSLWRDFHLNLKAAREDKEFQWQFSVV